LFSCLGPGVKSSNRIIIPLAVRPLGNTFVS
jgi:hypothetical protein